jgi:hypothetical protein
MNEWVLVGGVVLGTVVLLGGGGWIASVVRGSRGKNRDN